MTRYDFELEVMSYFETAKILNGQSKSGPSSEFMEKARELQKQLQQGIPITPKEAGWE